MEIITGYRAEPHITSAQDRAVNQGAFGQDSYILDVGTQLAAEIVTANEIRVHDGALSMQGCTASIDQGAYDTLEISNGSQGMLRTDLIVARYTKAAGTNIEDVELVVIEGTPAASSPATPSYNTGDIQAGDSPVDFPLYQVNIDGVAIDSVDLLAEVVPSLSGIDEILATPETGSGTASNTYASVAYNYSMIGKMVFVDFALTPTQAISTSTGGININLPAPAGDVYSPTHTNASVATVFGPARLIKGATPQFVAYGQRASGTVYYGSFAYIAA